MSLAAGTLARRAVAGSFAPLLLVLILTMTANAQNTVASSAKEQARATAGAYAQVNGINLYYQIHGTGKPLVLLHGGLGAIEMFGPVLPALAAHRKVIAVDLQGHGRTADIERPLSIEFMADDIAALLEHMDIERADIMGYSMGGGVAMQVAVRHPEVVDCLVLVSAAARSDAYYPELIAQQAMVGAEAAEMMKQTPMYQLYASIAPRPEDFPRLLQKIGDAMRTPYDYSSQLAAVQSPTLLVAGDSDMFPPSHAVEMFALLGGGKKDGGWDSSGMTQHRLAIMPGTTHYEIAEKPLLATLALGFLDSQAQSPVRPQ